MKVQPKNASLESNSAKKTVRGQPKMHWVKQCKKDCGGSVRNARWGLKVLQLNRYRNTTIHSFVFLHAPKGLLPGHLQEEDGTKVDGNEDGTKDRDPPKKNKEDLSATVKCWCYSRTQIREQSLQPRRVPLPWTDIVSLLDGAVPVGWAWPSSSEARHLCHLRGSVCFPCFLGPPNSFEKLALDLRLG